jgi:DNA repair protein RadC
MKTQKKTYLCHEVSIHYKRPLFETEKKITSSESAVEIFREFIDPKRIDHKEFFWLMLLSNNNQVIGMSEIAVGNTTGVVVNFKEIFQLAILTNATAIIIAHNHPSGTLKPSARDVELTRRMNASTTLLDIKLLDHLIITSESFYSLSDEGKM